MPFAVPGNRSRSAIVVLASSPLVAALCLAGCGARAPVTLTPPQPTSAAAATAQAGPARDTHENLNAVLWMQTAVEYRGAALGAYAHARTLLDAALNDPARSAAIEQQGQPLPVASAVVLDVDETVLDNSPYQAQQTQEGAGRFDPASWNRWARMATAEAVPGALEFLHYARSRGVKVVLITNRHGPTEEGATVENLRKLGFEITADDIHCLEEQGWTRDKTARRALVAKQYRVLLLVGDDFGDFVSVSGATLEARRALLVQHQAFLRDRWVVIPNPTYGSWESALTVGAQDRSDASILALKRAALRGMPRPPTP
jgi:acid phosphatase